MFSRKSAFIIIGFWFFLTVFFSFYSLKLHDVLRGGGFDATNAEYYKTQTTLSKHFGGFPCEVYVLVDLPKDYDLNSGSFFDELDNIFEDFKKDSSIEAFYHYGNTFDPSFISKDSKQALILIGFNQNEFEVQGKLKSLKTLLKPNSLTLNWIGTPEFYSALTVQSEKDALQGELIALPFLILVLLFMFRTLSGIILPLAMAGTSILITLGILFFVTKIYPLSIFVLNISSLLGIGLAVDYSLLMISRFREELALHPEDTELATRKTLKSAGHAVLASAFTVFIGLSSLFFFGLMIQTSMAIGGILVILIALAACLTLLPALFILMGSSINRFPVLPKKFFSQLTNSASFWEQLATRVMKFPLLTLVLLVLFFMTTAAPLLHLRMGTSNLEILPSNHPLRINTETLIKAFDQTPRGGEFLVLLEGLSITPRNQTAWQAEVTTWHDQLTHQNTHLLNSRLSFKTNETTHLAKITLTTDFHYGDPQAQSFLKKLRGSTLTLSKLSVGGEEARLNDFVEALYAHFPQALLFVVVLTYFVLLFSFRSYILPLKAIILTTLSLSYSYGALVLIFQNGYAASFLGIDPPGYVEAVLPILLFSILFGLSMDYEVFIISRMREAWLQTQNNDQSILIGVKSSTKLVSSAALGMIMVALGFSFAKILPVKAIGLGMILAVSVDATLIRGVLLPATMKLLGKWNWWGPKFLKDF